MRSTKSVLVTGGAGYIGSHACKALAEAGFHPIAYDNLAYGHRWAAKWGSLVEGDILDRRKLERVLKRHKPVAVMHFAAFAYVGESVEDPRKYYRNNILGSMNLAETMMDCGIDKIVFSSTCATYGIPSTNRISETDAQNPINPYGFTKLAIERMLQDYARAYGLRYISLRYFNAAGADPDGEIGEDHDPETHLIPRVLDVLLGKREHVDIYGTDYPTPDGTAVRDYIHVSDLSSAHVQALQRLLHNGDPISINLGIGRGYSVREVIASVERVTGQPVRAREMARRSGDPAVLVADASLATRVLNWRPRFAEIDDIIRTAWRWHSRARTVQKGVGVRATRRRPPTTKHRPRVRARR